MRYLLILIICLFSIIQQAHSQISKQLFSLPASAGGFSSVLVADIDNNNTNGLEIVKTSADGGIHALNSAGTLIWSSSIPNPNCVGSVGNRLHSSPALGVLDRSGRKAIVVGFGAIVSRSCDGGVLALDAGSGQQ